MKIILFVTLYLFAIELKAQVGPQIIHSSNKNAISYYVASSDYDVQGVIDIIRERLDKGLAVKQVISHSANKWLVLYGDFEKNKKYLPNTMKWIEIKNYFLFKSLNLPSDLEPYLHSLKDYNETPTISWNKVDDWVLKTKASNRYSSENLKNKLQPNSGYLVLLGNNYSLFYDPSAEVYTSKLDHWSLIANKQLNRPHPFNFATHSVFELPNNELLVTYTCDWGEDIERKTKGLHKKHFDYYIENENSLRKDLKVFLENVKTFENQHLNDITFTESGAWLAKVSDYTEIYNSFLKDKDAEAARRKSESFDNIMSGVNIIGKSLTTYYQNEAKALNESNRIREENARKQNEAQFQNSTTTKNSTVVNPGQQTTTNTNVASTNTYKEESSVAVPQGSFGQYKSCIKIEARRGTRCGSLESMEVVPTNICNEDMDYRLALWFTTERRWIIGTHYNVKPEQRGGEFTTSGFYSCNSDARMMIWARPSRLSSTLVFPSDPEIQKYK